MIKPSLYRRYRLFPLRHFITITTTPFRTPSAPRKRGFHRKTERSVTWLHQTFNRILLRTGFEKTTFSYTYGRFTPHTLYSLACEPILSIGTKRNNIISQSRLVVTPRHRLLFCNLFNLAPRPAFWRNTGGSFHSCPVSRAAECFKRKLHRFQLSNNESNIAVA